MALPMIAGAMMKGLLGGKSKKTGGALVKTKDAKIKQVRDNQPKVENKASFVGTSEAMYSKVASQKKISASDFKPESQQVKVETEANQETLKTQLDNLIENTSKLDEVLKKEYKEELANSRKKKSALSKDKAAKREKKLEQKSGGNLLGSALGKASSFNFMDMIGKFLLNTLLGGLALLTFNNLEQIGGFLKKYSSNLYLIFSGLRLGLVALKGFLKGTVGLGARLFKTGIKTTGKLILKTARGLGRLFKFGFTRLGDAIVDFARGAINAIRNLAGKPPLPGKPGRRGGRNSTTPGTRLNQKQRTATSSKAARKRYAQRYGNQAAKNRFKGNVSKPSGQSTKLQGKPNKFLQKLFGKKEAKAIAQNKGLFKNIFKGAKGFRIPIIGPFVSAIGSMLSGDPVKQTLFKSVGTGLGEALGTLIPIPVVGTILGGLIGEYGGDLLYTYLEGGGLSGIQTKMAQDWKNTLEQGAKFGQYMQDSWNRYYASLPKMNLFGNEVPDPGFLFNPGKIEENIGLIKNALFPPKNGTLPPSTVVSYGLTDPITGQTLNTTTPTAPGTTAPGTGPTGTVSGGNSDFWTLAAIASLEDSDAQGRADVAQSIYNRAASGAYSSTNIRELIIADGQYQPAYDYPRINPAGNKTNPEWLSIVDAQTAAAATGKSVAFVEQAARDIMNPTLQKNAKDFVGGRTDFTNYTKTNRRSEIYRSTGGKNNYFGWDWNYSGTVQGNVPDFGATQSPSSVTPVTQPVTSSGITPAQMQQKLAEQKAATEAAGYSGQTPAQTAPVITTAPQQPIPAVSQSASYEQQGTVPVVVPLPSPNQQQTPVMSKRSGVPMVGGSTIDMVNSYYKAQLLANLYKQG